MQLLYMKTIYYRFTTPNRKQLFIFASGLAQECVPLLELSKRRKLVKENEQASLCQDLETIVKMISGLINRLDKRKT